MNKLWGYFLTAVLLAGCATLPTSSEWTARGDGYLKDGKLDKALKAYNRAIVLNPDNLDAYAARGSVLFFDGNFELAAEDFKHVLSINPYYADAYTAYGSVLAAQQNFEQALNMLNIAIQLKPSKPESYFSRGGVYLMLGKYDKAVADYTAVLQYYPAADVYNARAIAYQKWGKTKLAEQDFQTAQTATMPAELAVYSVFR